jgi:hypothetical protein
MNWTAITAFAEVVGAAAVVISLVYLAMQIRQNTRAVRGAMYDSMVCTNIEFLHALAVDGALAAKFERAVDEWGTLAPDDQRQANFVFFQMFRLWENAYYQSRQGTLEPWLWQSWRHLMLSYFGRAGVQNWWHSRRKVFSADYREFLESAPQLEDPMPMVSDLRAPANAR